MVQNIDKNAVILHVTTSVPCGLVSSLFPEHKSLWDSISNTKELTKFIEHLADKYLLLYEQYSNLAWLDTIRSYTCKSERTQTTRGEWAPVLAKHDSTVSESTQATVLASILHAVQEEIQSQMATHIQKNHKPLLYRISGWAIKSAIDYRLKKKDKKIDIVDELLLLKELKRSKASKSTFTSWCPVFGSWRLNIHKAGVFKMDMCD